MSIICLFQSIVRQTNRITNVKNELMEWGRSMPEFDLATVIFYVGIITKNLWVEFLRKIIWKFVWVVLFGVFFSHWDYTQLHYIL